MVGWKYWNIWKLYNYVGMYCKSTSIVVALVSCWFVVGSSRAKSRGCYIYRGNAAEFSLDKNKAKRILKY